MDVRNGIDNIQEYDYLFMNKRIGLVTNITGLNKNYVSTIDIVNKLYDLKILFSPEHGLRGEYQAGDDIEDYIDKVTNKPVISLYGSKRSPTDEELKNIDILIYDIQDLGIRYYTYIYTMYLCMEACSKNNIKFVILDRINPLGGAFIEGNILENKYSSFVGMLPIPNIYGLTIGELALYINSSKNINCDLEIIKITGWKRGKKINETDLPWIPPSPNIPTLDSALVYGGTCLFEGTNVSEGRGTTKPFEIIGAPWIECNKLSNELNKIGELGVYFRPVYFIPKFSKYKDELCSGVQIHIKDYTKFSPVRIALIILYKIKELYPSKFKFHINSKGFKYDFFKHLAGCDYIFKKSLRDVFEKYKQDENEFKKLIAKYRLY
ncbi:MAG: DUF1343 domain-containing protein [Clostridium baratii]|uniref:exo-beta-N-acetylmuramidase NamZ family protein n=1 Tax=Clostridium baratii TaxID=1561 RepID=UPI002430C2ED|nr:DUF1343 domain-containing protein [Clostridium baratii]MBS6041484.1 DUF1343 domain-containing protein [Clostridium baratii]